MDGQELEEIRRELGLSIKELAELLNTPYRTVQNWLRNENRIPGIVDAMVDCLQRERMRK